LQDTELNTVYEKYCGQVSLADFLVIAGEAVMIRTATDFDAADPFKDKTLGDTFRDRFRYGRTTVEECAGTNLMPDPEEGCSDLESIFIDHIYNRIKKKRFAWRLTAAISGAHTLGSAKAENSGYSGTWVSPENMGTFDNEYFHSILTKGWGPQKAVGGNPDRNQWQRIDKVEGTSEMMLNSDLCLAYDNNLLHAACMSENNRKFKACRQFQNKGNFLSAADSQCCAWTRQNALFKNGVLAPMRSNEYCGESISSSKGNFRNSCCQAEGADSTGDCDSANWPKGPAFGAIVKFAADERAWLKDYAKAWWVATENGNEKGTLRRAKKPKRSKSNKKPKPNQKKSGKKEKKSMENKKPKGKK